MLFKPPILVHEPQHVRHENVGHRTGFRQPFASSEHRFQMPKPTLEKLLELLRYRRLARIARELQNSPRATPPFQPN